MTTPVCQPFKHVRKSARKIIVHVVHVESFKSCKIQFFIDFWASIIQTLPLIVHSMKYYLVHFDDL